MKIVAIIPIKSQSKRVKRKNFRLINGKPLYRYLLDKLKKTNFDEIYVDSDSKEIESYCKKNKFFFIQRKNYLKKDKANGNDLLKCDLSSLLTSSWEFSNSNFNFFKTFPHY